MTHYNFRVLLAVIVIALATTTSVAQLFPGRVTGRVRDEQGAVVSGATLKLTNPDTGFERAITTDESGEFNFPELALGSYELTASKAGFQTILIKNIRTSQGQVNTLAPVLKVGTVTTQVEVSSELPLIQTETNSAGGGEVSAEIISALPIGNSDFTRLALTMPGVTQNSNFAFAQYTINGSRAALERVQH